MGEYHATDSNNSRLCSCHFVGLAKLKGQNTQGLILVASCYHLRQKVSVGGNGLPGAEKGVTRLGMCWGCINHI